MLKSADFKERDLKFKIHKQEHDNWSINQSIFFLVSDQKMKNKIMIN